LGHYSPSALKVTVSWNHEEETAHHSPDLGALTADDPD
jgi:hypothetical protein